MSLFPSPRCSTCKTVLSPTWSRCQVCRSPIPKHSSLPQPGTPHCRLQPGDRIVFKAHDGLHEGTVREVIMSGDQFTCALHSGASISSHSIRAVGFRKADGTIREAVTVRGEELLMYEDTLPTTPTAAPGQRSSSWYRHWKDIADLTAGILPHEPRLRPILSMVERCNEAYKHNDETGFLRLKDQLSNLVKASAPRPVRSAS
jgi:hypothetical protein